MPWCRRLPASARMPPAASPVSSAAAASATGGRRREVRAAAEAGAAGGRVAGARPRGEAGGAIVADSMAGCRDAGRVAVERGRAAAIARAVGAAGRGDIVLVAGKGHEPYQEI